MLIFVLIFMAITSMVLGVLQLRKIGPLLNNAYIWNSEEGRKKLIKRPYYIQSGIILILISLSFILTLIDHMYPNDIIKYLQIIDFVFIFIFAIGSSIYIGLKNINKGK